MEAINSYQKTQTRLEAQNKSMEQQLALLSRYVAAQRQEAPLEVRRIVQAHTKKPSFGSKIFAAKFTGDEEEDPKRNFRTGVSAPNLFSKITREDVMNAANAERNQPLDSDRRHFMMRKSQSIHSGLIASQRHYPMKVLEERNDQRQFRTEIISESLKELGKRNSGYFASTHEQIRQERMFEQQLKHDFDENLRRLDRELAPAVDEFQGRRSMSLNLSRNAKAQEPKSDDSGFATPLSPSEADRKEEVGSSASLVSHPLSDCDVDIKFDGQSTKLKQIRPLKHTNLETAQ